MDDETRTRIEQVETRLADFGNKNIELQNYLETIKTVLLQGTAAKAALSVRLELLSGRENSSKKPEDYRLIVGLAETQKEEKWKLDVNDRYQKAVGTIISLSTAVLGSPLLLLKDLHGKGILSILNGPAIIGAICLGSSIISAVLYYYFSAKWVKLAHGQVADIFFFKASPKVVEPLLDITYGIMMGGFLVGVLLTLNFIASYVPN